MDDYTVFGNPNNKEYEVPIDIFPSNMANSFNIFSEWGGKYIQIYSLTIACNKRSCKYSAASNIRRKYFLKNNFWAIMDNKFKSYKSKFKA